MGLGSGIEGVKKAPDPESGSATLAGSRYRTIPGKLFGLVQGNKLDVSWRFSHVCERALWRISQLKNPSHNHIYEV